MPDWTILGNLGADFTDAYDKGVKRRQDEEAPLVLANLYDAAAGARARAPAADLTVPPSSPASAPAAPTGPLAVSPDDLDTVARTVAAEAGNQGAAGMAAAAHVIANRARIAGIAPGAVVEKPGQFEAYDSGAADKYDPGHPAYDTARKIAEQVFAGRIPDITGGATHYLNPDLQAKMGRAQPGWAPGDGKRIGAHVFYALPDDVKAIYASGKGAPAATDESGDDAPAKPAFTGFAGVSGAGGRAQFNDPAVRAAITAAWQNPNTRAFATTLMSDMLKGKDGELEMKEAGDGYVIFNKRTGAVTPVAGLGSKSKADAMQIVKDDTTGEQFLVNKSDPSAKPTRLDLPAAAAGAPAPVPPGVDPKTYRAELAKKTVAEQKDATDRGRVAEQAMPILDRAEQAYAALAKNSALGPLNASTVNRTVGGVFGMQNEKLKQDYEAAASELQLLQAQLKMKGQGAISDSERRLLALTLPKLDAADGSTGLTTLRTFRQQLQRARDAEKLSTYGQGGGTPAAAPPASYKGDPGLWQHMTPEERALWN